MIKDIINKVVNKENLTFEEMEDVMNYILGGQASPAQVAAFLVALRLKEETEVEIAAGANTLRNHSTPILNHTDSLDTCGTGGDGANTFNISTTVAIVCSAAGVKVVKQEPQHGRQVILIRLSEVRPGKTITGSARPFPSLPCACRRDPGSIWLY